MKEEISMATLVARLGQLEDIEAIRRLTATYGLYINKGWNGKEIDVVKLPLVFAANARWQSAAMKVNVVGAEAIAQMLKTQTVNVAFAMHSFTNPIIVVQGDTASGNWLLWVATKSGSGIMEVFQSEELEYVRNASGWLIQSINLHYGDILKP